VREIGSNRPPHLRHRRHTVSVCTCRPLGQAKGGTKQHSHAVSDVKRHVRRDRQSSAGGSETGLASRIRVSVQCLSRPMKVLLTSMWVRPRVTWSQVRIYRRSPTCSLSRSPLGFSDVLRTTSRSDQPKHARPQRFSGTHTALDARSPLDVTRIDRDLSLSRSAYLNARRRCPDTTGFTRR